MEVFDSHFHIIDHRYPLVPNQGYTPPEFRTADYRTATQAMNVLGGVVVSGSFQAFDQTYLKDALTELGDSYYGVANIPNDLSDQELSELSQFNVVGVRFNPHRGGFRPSEKLGSPVE